MFLEGAAGHGDTGGLTSKLSCAGWEACSAPYEGRAPGKM